MVYCDFAGIGRWCCSWLVVRLYGGCRLYPGIAWSVFCRLWRFGCSRMQLCILQNQLDLLWYKVKNAKTFNAYIRHNICSVDVCIGSAADGCYSCMGVLLSFALRYHHCHGDCGHLPFKKIQCYRLELRCRYSKRSNSCILLRYVYRACKGRRTSLF